ncbi:MAG: hypothetical protein U0T82_03325 [Bacteroidales bacterium]
MLSINLSGFEWKIKEFSHPVITCGQFANPAKTNSFYLDKVLYQFYGCNGQFVLRGINSETDSIIKEYLGFKGVEVSFMNSPVIKEGESNVFPALIGGDFRRKEVEKMNGFYRNLGSGRLGVDVYSRKNELELMIGTFIETTGGGGAPMMMGQQSFTVRPPAYTGVGPQTIKWVPQL